jgi:phosphatidylserine/phosphatidylglycerophosphate/cardiolipin synthase-like enzyme
MAGVYSLIFVLMAFLMLAVLTFAQDPCPTIEVYFSPKGGCNEAIIREITNAKSAVLVQAYWLTSDLICKGLRDAHKRGLEVKVIVDKRRRFQGYSEVDFFYNEGIPVRIDSVHVIAHDKTIVLDGCVVITGSFNFTKKAEEGNAENLLVIRDKKLAEKYTENWWRHWLHSQSYEGKNPR